jgi:hypothetical protein
VSDASRIEAEVLRRERVTLDDLFLDMSRFEGSAIGRWLWDMPTDVLLSEGAGALGDASAYLRFVTEQHAAPGGPEARHMLELAAELERQAAVFQHAADSAAIAMREADRERSGEDVRPAPGTRDS